MSITSDSRPVAHFGKLLTRPRFSAAYFAEEKSRARGDSPCRLCGHYTDDKVYGYCSACYKALSEHVQQRSREAENMPCLLRCEDAQILDWEKECLPGKEDK